MTALTAFLASYVVSALWQVPLLYLAGCVVARIVRRIGPAAEHRVWVAVLLLSIVIPALPAPVMHGHSVAVVMSDIHENRSVWETSGSALGWDIPLWLGLRAMQAIVVFWLLTVAYAITRLLVGLHRTHRMVATASAYPLQANDAQLWQHCVAQFGLTNTRVLETNAIQSPVTVSQAGHHLLLLPRQFFNAVPIEDVQAALAHECAHMRRHDYRNNILLQAAAAAIFFHPFTRPMRRQFVSTREMACDADASVQVGSAIAYRAALVNLAMWIAQGNPAPRMTAAIGIFDSHSLEDRLNRLEKEMPNISTIARYALAAVAFFGITATASALALNGMRLLPATAASSDSAPTLLPALASTPAAASSTPKPISAAKPKGKLIMPILVHQVDPDYPASARSRGERGEHICIVAITVDTDGVPRNVHIAQTGGAEFDENSIIAVNQYRFKPATQAGKPVATDMKVAVDYKFF